MLDILYFLLGLVVKILCYMSLFGFLSWILPIMWIMVTKPGKVGCLPWFNDGSL